MNLDGSGIRGILGTEVPGSMLGGSIQIMFPFSLI